MTGAVQGEALIALTAEAAWGIVAAPPGTTWARPGQALVIVCRRQAGPRGGRGTMMPGLPPDQLFQTHLNLSEASVSPAVKGGPEHCPLHRNVTNI